MKPLKVLSVFIILIGMLGCDPDATFSEPQPVDTDNLAKLPDRLQGQYLSLTDSTTLSISDKLIRRIYDLDEMVHPNQLDSTTRLVGDTLIDLNTNERYPIRHEGDSLVAHIHGIDTLFQMNYDNVARKFKGYYFLNIRKGKASWEVKKVQLTKGKLVIGSISKAPDIDNLKELTETTQDTVGPYIFTTTKRQFKKFIKNNGFSDSEVFVRQK